MYKLICLICSEQHIDLQYNNDVDTRVSVFRASQQDSEQQPVAHSFLNLPSVAASRRSWQRVLSLDGEDGELILQGFLRLRSLEKATKGSEMAAERLPGGVVMRRSQNANLNSESEDYHRHLSVAVGGTFDHLHAGHKLLLSMTALVLDSGPTNESCLTVGITGDELLKNKKYRDELEDFVQRQRLIQDFVLGFLELLSPYHILERSFNLEPSGSQNREIHNILKSGVVIKYVEIFDPCGPTITEESITALVLSGETRQGGQVVNDKRREKGWVPLEIFEVDVLDAREGDGDRTDNNFESKISSTDIRRRLHQKLSDRSI
ncbi:hypothetical protein MMC21_004144 [Puttea exsequens]|nr:hypothetical protein [Puttea exsequens]